MEWKVNLPDQEWLTAKEAAAWLGIPEPTWKQWEREKQIPPGRQWSKKAKRWHREVVLAISILVKANFLPMKEIAGDAGDDED